MAEAHWHETRPLELADRKNGMAWASALLLAQLDRERGRWFFWIPVFFGAGIATYFALPEEPPLLLAVAGLMASLALRIFMRGSLLLFLLGSIVLAVACGFAAAKLRALWVAAPIVHAQTKTERLAGWVERWEQTSPKRGRATLRVISVDGLEAARTPRRVRISLNTATGPPLGQAISLKAVLLPLPEPVMPGGFDFARQAWFQGIGATGFAIGGFEAMEPQPDAPLLLTLHAWINGLREEIARRVHAALPAEQAGIAQALIVGDRAALGKEESEALRASGLFHIISISGLHMALIAGALFWAARLAFAAVPALALNYSVKAWAALLALGCAFVYFLLSGAAVATQRAFLMVVVMLIAVMLSRPAISLRNVALAALIILALYPETLLDVSFQMSFAATAALVAFYERFGATLRFETGKTSLHGAAAWILAFLFGTAMTTIVAGTAVTPFAAYHFNTVTSYSVLGNVLGMPFVTLVIMPCVVLTLLAMPFGLEAWPLAAMGLGIDALRAVAAWVAGLHGAVVKVPSFTGSALMLICLGGLWFIIWRGPWRLLGLLAVALGLALAPYAPKPDVLVDRFAEVIAVRDAAGRLQVSPGRKGRYTVERWLAADGDGRTPKEAMTSSLFRCDPAGCLAQVKGKLVSLTREPTALADDCARVDILIAPFAVTADCRRPSLVIDRRFVYLNGAVSVFIGKDGIEVASVANSRGQRPWIVTRSAKASIDPLPEAPAE
jgi:competence protein ComEC